jgi:hypothetical protein
MIINDIHLLLPFTSLPTPGTKTNANKINPNINKMGAIFCQKYRGIKNAIYPKIKPNNIYMDCLIK